MAGTTKFWVGASTAGELGSPARGIRSLEVDETGATRLGEPIDVGPNPMFLAQQNDLLAVAHELDEGLVSTWRIVGDDLQPIAPPATTGSAGPCHVAFDAEGTRVFAANYVGGRLSVHDAATGALLAAFDFAGSGPRFDRQESPHAHQSVFDPARKRVLVNDLGSDRVRSIRFTVTGEPSHDPADDLVIHAGAGPRHLVIDDDLAIVANELDRTASLVDLATGDELSVTQVGPDVTPRGLGLSAIRLTRAGTVLIGDRDLDGIQALRVDASRRTLERIGELVTGGKHPRDIELTPDERFLLVADQASDSIAIVELDNAGVPQRVVTTIETPAPACIARD